MYEKYTFKLWVSVRSPLTVICWAFQCELFIWTIDIRNLVVWKALPQVILSRLLLRSHLFCAKYLGYFLYLQVQRLHSLHGQPVPVFDCLHNKILFPYVVSISHIATHVVILLLSTLHL